jgi:hypothetical protein
MTSGINGLRERDRAADCKRLFELGDDQSNAGAMQAQGNARGEVPASAQ